jgi:predicted DNA-binding protein
MKSNYKMINLNLPEEVNSKIDTISRKIGIQKSNFIKIAIANYIKKI